DASSRMRSAYRLSRLSQYITALCQSFRETDAANSLQLYALTSLAAQQPVTTQFYDFRILNNPGEVQAVMQRLGSAASATIVEAAFNRLKQLRDSAPRHFLDDLSRQASGLAATMTPKNVAAILHACAKMGYKNREMFQALVSQVAAPHKISSFDCMESSSILYALGLLQRTQDQRNSVVGSEPYNIEGSLEPRRGLIPVFQMQEAFVSSLVHEMLNQDLFALCSEQQLAKVIYGLGRLKHQDNMIALSLVREVTKSHRLESFKFIELTAIWFGLGQMEIKHGEALMPMALEMVRPERLSIFTSAEISMILLSAAWMKIDNEQFLSKLCKEISKKDRKCSSQTGSPGFRIWVYLACSRASQRNSTQTRLA
ncbi:unnamed protein product, partial [Ostreobium quekettii]